MLGLLLTAALAQTPPPMLWTGCTWTDAPFEKNAKLQVAGLRKPVAEVWGSANRVAVSGVLGQDLYGRKSFSAVYSRDGVSIAGSADLAESQLFRLSGEGPVDIGPAGKLVVGADLDVVGFATGEILVTADQWAREDLKRGAGVARVGCSRLSVTRGVQWLSDEAIVAATFPGTHEAQRIPEKTPLALRERPDGRVVAKLAPFDWNRQVWVLAQSDSWSQIAIPHWTGAVWHGWVRDLPQAEPSDGGMGVLGGLGGAGEPIPLLSCPSVQVLWVSNGRTGAALGAVAAGTELLAIEDGVDTVQVVIDGYWLSAMEGWHFEVRDAASCTRSTRERPPAVGLDAVFEDLAE